MKLKIFVVSFSRSSNGAIGKLLQALKKEDMLTDSLEAARYILAVGDRKETFDFCLPQWRAGKEIIHLWAGEISQGTHDEVYRHSITLMSSIQFCTNKESEKVVKKILTAAGMNPNSVVVGNLMKDDLSLDETVFEEYNVERGKYNLILYNPCRYNITRDLKEIFDALAVMPDIPYIWIRANMDHGTEYIMQYVNSGNQARPRFLALLKHCNKFITNSSCEFYEAPFLIAKEQIVHIGDRNRERNSKYSNMDIGNATKKIIRTLRKLEKALNTRVEKDDIPIVSPPSAEVDIVAQ